MFHPKFYQKILMFLLLHLGILRDATQKDNITDDRIPALGAGYCVMWQSKRKVVTTQKSFLIELLVCKAKTEERTRTGTELPDRQNCLIECCVGGRHLCF